MLPPTQLMLSVLCFCLMALEDFLEDLLLKAGAKLKKHYGNVKTISYKAGAAINLVTNVDREIEAYIKKRIRREFPSDSILAEESELENEHAPQRWVIDPLDGTTNFAHGLPLFCISIGVELNGEIIAGGVIDPIHSELFLAFKGKGARLNGKEIHVSDAQTVLQSLLVTGFPYDIHEHPERSLPYFNAVIQRAQGLRRLGSAALDLCYVACGRFDGFFEVYLHPWDTAAGMLIVQEAGGLVTDFEGTPFSIYKRELAATNGPVHAEMLQIIQQVKSRVTTKTQSLL